MKSRFALPCAALGLFACATAGSTWVAEPLPGSESGFYEPLLSAEVPARRTVPRTVAPASRTLGPTTIDEQGEVTQPEAGPTQRGPIAGRAIGTFRNTYYDFPSELDFEGANVDLKNGRCETVAAVRRGFFEALCVQGSGTVRQGTTVSFAKRDCECADVCPRTGQKICFDLLDAKEFPWGRGATGKPIMPLTTVAVDPDVIALGTPLYVPEFDGLPRDLDETTRHDGCFIAQDRGLKVKGQHLDIFTGHSSMTKLWNRLVPSNKGVTVVLDSPKCDRAAPAPLPATEGSAPRRESDKAKKPKN